VPYGFKNSLPALVRAIKSALGDDHLKNVVLHWQHKVRSSIVVY
jgi:hypothetical protein